MEENLKSKATLKDPLQVYKSRKEYFEKQNIKFKKDISIIGYFRMLVFLIGVSVTVYTIYMKSYFISGGVFILSVGMFIYLVVKHSEVIETQKYTEALIEINKRGIQRIEGKWDCFKDDGEEFIDYEHNYSSDLDMFGKNSLFQWMNNTGTYMGKQKLKKILINHLKDSTEITKTQEKVKKLCEEIEWRQQFNAEAVLISDESKNPYDLIKWGEEEDNDNTYNSITLKLIVYIMPLITLTLIILPFFIKSMSYRLASLGILIQIIMLLVGVKKREVILGSIYRCKESIKIYEKLLNLIENNEFSFKYFKEYCSGMTGTDSKKASEAVKKLSSIGDLISDRRNMFYIIINILFLWDYRCMFKLEDWRASYGKKIKIWLEAIGDLEVLNSIASICYENKDWTFPTISEQNVVFSAESLGHPLLKRDRVCNDVAIKQCSSVLLITGSNMSGKSTLLRTVGINLVLAYLGAPVCAKKFECSIMDIYTCMRTSDNLEKNISSFYAEILKIKNIVLAAKEEKKVFFLLDEIFKGTNSIDRHEGASVLIKQLIRDGASGMVSTHDLELGDLEKVNPKIKNYHFEEYYKDNKLCFDYKLRKGVSTTRNAIHIMKMAGIKL